MPKVDDTATLIAKQTITEIQLIEILRYETRKRPEYNHIVGVAIKKCRSKPRLVATGKPNGL